MRIHLLAAGVALMLLACRGADSGTPARSERERDSIIGQSKLPGAGGVRGALSAGDSARSRNAALDSVDQ